eukprot:TRINITY_DN3021_c0_g1_i3.p1 TRINITY_DN3021_c0_g1~~TRINITY_DN3021_c0_g1_i3.p1  ORF type:complete len:181 (-),score=23.06 TRINITY_DN3021_c0_g1_i3:135-677(-)
MRTNEAKRSSSVLSSSDNAHKPLKKRTLPELKQHTHRKRRRFVLDCCNATESKLPAYNGLRDDFLTELFERPIFRKQIKHIKSLLRVRKKSKEPLAVRLPEIRKRRSGTGASRNTASSYANMPLTTYNIYMQRKSKVDASMKQIKTKESSQPVKPITSNDLKKLIDKYKKVRYDFMSDPQ